MYKRVARVLTKDEDLAYDYQRIMFEHKFLPNSPTLRNAGTNRTGNLSACFVLPVYDSLQSIYKTLTDAAIIHNAFGGTGFNFSHLRPRGSLIHSTGGQACGPVAVMKLYNESASVVRQGGIREGANMGILNIDHPDILDFITAKDTHDLSHFNLSVAVTDKYMESQDEIWHLIPEQAWKTGCPGLIFIDEINRHNWAPELGPIEATNPCGEQPLPPYGSCNLGSLNLASFIKHGEFDHDQFEETVTLAVKMLDAVININTYPIPEVEKVTRDYRPIGLGVMGWADTLIMLGIEWCSTDSLRLIDEIGKSLKVTAHDTSGALADDIGGKGPYLACGQKDIDPQRNACCTTIAPAGSLHIIAGCNEGIEPIYGWKVTRSDESGSRTIDHPLYELAKKNGLLEDTALNIPFDWHIQHQARWQLHIDNAVSKTVNLPSSATVEDVNRAYRLAFELKCKGITIYRDGSKTTQVLTAKQPTMTKSRELLARRRKFSSGCGNIRVDCADLLERPGVPYEVVILTTGGCEALNEALGKIVSKYIHDPRLAGDETQTVSRICYSLHRVRCPVAMHNPKAEGKSCPDLIARYMEQVWAHGGIVNVKKACPECGEELKFGSGCAQGECDNCGWSGCT